MTDWVQKMKNTVQPHVPEPVLAVGMLQPAGTWGATGLGQLSGLAGMIEQRKANKSAGGLASGPIFKQTKMAVIALTADKVYAFSGKPGGRGWKIKDHLATWEQKDLKIATEAGKMATKVTIDVTSTGDHYELEATTFGDRGFTDAFLTELAKV
ncbi:MAG: hypothetical protein ACT4PI_05625 [Actinomycetota bacterium]